MHRKREFVTVGYFLSRYGNQTDELVLPPIELKTSSWRHAYAAFFDQLGEGRSLGSFSNSLKATRDAFDSWLDSGRVGWRLPDSNTPQPLHSVEAAVFAECSLKSRDAVWEIIGKFCDAQVALVAAKTLDDIENEDTSDSGSGSKTVTEGGRKVIASFRIERSPSARNDALKVHGYDCQVCGFNFQEAYGDWGKQFAEVHHLIPLGSSPNPRDTNTKTDMAVVCANCHRMLHRKKNMVLDVKELSSKIKKRWK